MLNSDSSYHRLASEHFFKKTNFLRLSDNKLKNFSMYLDFYYFIITYYLLLFYIM